MIRRSIVLLLTSVLFCLLCMPARADKQKPPAGMGKYVFILKHAPPVPPGQTPKKIEPPDVTKWGGVVVQVHDDYRVVFLPFTAVKQLLKDDNVDYLQRIWMGESPDEWRATESLAATPPDAAKRLTADSLTETASWGPKNYSYDGSGNIKQIAEFDTAGNIKTQGTQKFRYDAVSRLKEAVVNSVTESYSYDAFGNLTQKQTGGDPAAVFNVDSTSNRISTDTYDIAGNVTRDPNDLYFYDELGLLSGMTASGGAKRMFYTASDERVGFSLGPSGSFSRWMIRDFEGRPLREFRGEISLQNFQDAEWIWTEDYVYAGGQLVGGETAGPYGVNQGTIAFGWRRRHYHLDHLGSVRLITGELDAVALGVHDYYPFGAEQTLINQEEYNFGGTSGPIRPEPVRFTGHERDFNGWWNVENTDYIDYMHARYYDPHRGRFLSPDRTWSSAALMRPQSWNRYVYVEGNPINTIDPDGRAPCSVPSALLGPVGCFGEIAVRGAIQDYSDAKEAASVLFGKGSSLLERFMAQKTLELIVTKNMLPFIAPTGGATQASLSAGERSVINEAGAILRSQALKDAIAALRAGTDGATFTIGRYEIVASTELETVSGQASAMTFRGTDNSATFLLGRNALRSNDELIKTIVHELYRLLQQEAGVGTGELAAESTKLASEFAETAVQFFSDIRIIMP